MQHNTMQNTLMEEEIDIEKMLENGNIDFDNFDFSNSFSQNKKYDLLPSTTNNATIPEMPTPSFIKISTKTKTFSFNAEFDIFDIFWKINIIPYSIFAENIIKKQLRIRSYNKETTEMQDTFIEKEKQKGYFTKIFVQTNVNHTNLIYNTANNDATNDVEETVNEANNKERELNISKKVKNQYVLTRTITVGLCKKEVLKTNIVPKSVKNAETVAKNAKMKRGGTFYNSFAVWFRLLFCNQYQEIHAKVFNTGKIEIPGIKEPIIEQKILQILKSFMRTITNNNELEYKNAEGELVLINSSFHLYFQINKHILAGILTEIYKWHVTSDTNSYPGVRCVYFYNTKLGENEQTGKASNEFLDFFKKNTKKNNIKTFIKKNNTDYKLITIIFFSTGSCLINGTFSDEILYFIHRKICEIFKTYYGNLYMQPYKKPLQPKNKKKIRMEIFHLSNTNTNI